MIYAIKQQYQNYQELGKQQQVVTDVIVEIINRVVGQMSSFRSDYDIDI